MKTNFFDYLDFALQFAPAAAERERRSARSWRASASAPARPSTSGPVARGQGRNRCSGMKDGERKVDAAVKTIGKNINGWRVGSVFGDSAFFNGDWLLRAVGRADGHLRQRRRRGDVSGHARSMSTGSPLDGSQAQLHADLPGRPAAAGERVLVGDDVRRQDAVADREPDQPVSDQFADAAEHEDERGRVADALHPEQVAGRRTRNRTGCRRRTARSTWSCGSTGRRPRRRRSCRPGEGTWQPPGIKRARDGADRRGQLQRIERSAPTDAAETALDSVGFRRTSW